MALSSVIASTLLSTGEVTADATVTTGTAEKIELRLTATQVSTSDSQVRLVVLDASGHVKKTLIINNAGTEEIEIERISGNLTVYVACLFGSSRVVLQRATGLQGASGEGAAALSTTDIEDLAITTAKLALLAVDTGQLAADALAASAAGRAKFADDLFTATEFAAGAGGKFAPDALVEAGLENLIADNAYTAAILLAKIVANGFDAAACANAFAAGAIPVAKVASAPLSLESTTADPGTGNPIPANVTTSIAITTAAAETNTLAAPSAVGKVLSLTLDVRVVGDRVITVATAINQAGNTIITLDTAGDNIVLVGVQIAGVPAWRVLQNDGCTLS